MPHWLNMTKKQTRITFSWAVLGLIARYNFSFTTQNIQLNTALLQMKYNPSFLVHVVFPEIFIYIYSKNKQFHKRIVITE